jgi:ABC-type amino acid transport substrate-binding protein
MKNLFITALVAATISFTVCYLSRTKTNLSTLLPQREATFDRIMRTRTIRCGYQVWPPAFIKDLNTGKMSGINYDFAEEIAGELNLKIEWAAEVGSGDAVQALNANKFDVMCTSMWPDAGRLSQTEYTLPTYFSTIYPYVRSDDSRFDNNLAAADNENIHTGGIEGDVTQDVAVKLLPKASHLALPQMVDGSQLILSLVTKKTDIVMIDDALALSYLKTNPGLIRKVSGIGAVRVFGEHLVIPKDDFRLLNMLNTTILTLVNSGSMDRILKNYDGTFFAPQKLYAPVEIHGGHS